MGVWAGGDAGDVAVLNQVDKVTTQLEQSLSKNLKETQTIPQLLLEISTALSQPTELDEN